MADLPFQEAVNVFLLGFPALFSIVNPISGAFIFRGVTASRTTRERSMIARRVALYSLIVMMGSLWAGTYILAFFGITVAALRIAGGIAVALSGWHMLNAPEQHEERKQEEAASSEGVEDVALFPLTIPFTTGPGTIAVAVALGAGHPKVLDELGWFFLGMSAAAAVMAALIWVTYHYADRLAEMTGPNGSRTISRIAAFLLLCIGVQILIKGVEDVLGPMLAAR